MRCNLWRHRGQSTRCWSRAGSPVWHIRRVFSWASPLMNRNSGAIRFSIMAVATLLKPSLNFRPAREDEVECMAELFANPAFMRFSLGLFTKREQTVAFIEKIIGWDRAEIPSQFAVMTRNAAA